MSIKYLIILLTNAFFLLNSSVKADNTNYIVGNNQDKITERIDTFFIKNPNDESLIWVPEIKGKSRYAFLIQKNAYLISKKYLDSNDLYYLSEKIDLGLNFEPKSLKNIDLSLLRNDFNLTYTQRFSQGLNIGIFFEKKENSFGVILNKNFIISKNSMTNFGFKQPKHEQTIFNARYTKLNKNESSELYGSISHEFKSNIIDANIGHTWFEVADQFDLTLNIKQKNKKTVSDIYASFDRENTMFQIGLKDINNTPEMNIFFNLKFENVLRKKHPRLNVNLMSKNYIINDNNISLKSFRALNLDSIWKKYVKF